MHSITTKAPWQLGKVLNISELGKQMPVLRLCLISMNIYIVDPGVILLHWSLIIFFFFIIYNCM